MDTLSWIFLYLILPLALGVFGNFATPWVQSYLKKSSLSLRERRIDVLGFNYARTKFSWTHPDFFIVYLFRQMAIILILFLLDFVIASYFVLVNVISVENRIAPPISLQASYPIIISVFSILPFYFLLKLWKDTNDVIGFATYKRKAIDKLKKLGGNPEDLDLHF